MILCEAQDGQYLCVRLSPMIGFGQPLFMIPNGGVVSDGEILQFLNPDDPSGAPLIEYPAYAVSEMFGVAVQESEYGRTWALAMRFGSAAVQSLAEPQDSRTGAQGDK